MESRKSDWQTIDEYVGAFSGDTRKVLQELRAAIQAAAPMATERISYGIPTFYLNGNLVHFAAFKNHIGFYPTSSGVEAFAQELAAYETSRGTVRFPLGSPLPLDLICRIVEFRVAESGISKPAKPAQRAGKRVRGA
jgi:uncharacterized protein YdhG (YjbR/CyaY superfamily)